MPRFGMDEMARPWICLGEQRRHSGFLALTWDQKKGLNIGDPHIGFLFGVLLTAAHKGHLHPACQSVR